MLSVHLLRPYLACNAKLQELVFVAMPITCQQFQHFPNLFGDCEAYGVKPTKSFYPTLLWPLRVHLFLGDVCQNYLSLNSSDRKDTHFSSTSLLSDNALETGWYRFQGEAGTRMPTSCVQKQRCGGKFSGWLKDAHPTKADGEEIKEVCFSNNSGRKNDILCCWKTTRIRVKNCGSHYVYRLIKTEGAEMRYCGTDQ